MKTRPPAFAAGLLAVALGLTACGGGDDTSASGNGYEGGTLTVLGSAPEINAAWKANVDRQFEQRTGAKIKWLPGSAPNNLTKLITSRGGQAPADVVFLDTPSQTQAAQAGVLEKLDRKRLTESGGQLPDEVFPNDGYGPAGIVIRLGTCVNTQELKKAGVTLSGSVNDWFDPKIKGRFAMPDSSTFYTQATLPAIAQHFGVPFNDPAGLLNRIQQAQPAAFWTSTADVQQGLQSGQIWVSPLIDGRCLNLKIKGEPVDFEPLNLSIGGKTYRYVGFYDTWDLVKGTEKPNLAHAFIDIAENQASMSKLQKDFGYLPARTDLLEKAKKDPELKEMVGDYNRGEMFVPNYREWYEKYATQWQDAWNQRFKK